LKKSSKLNKWVEINIPVFHDVEEAVSNFLFENGCKGCYADEGILHAYFEQSNWDLQAADRFKNYLRELNNLGFDIDLQKLHTRFFEDQDWNAIWKSSLKPIQITPDLIIKPTWVKEQMPEHATIIEIDPQMAFGSGSHATTQLVVKLMQNYLQPKQQILDVGTGSGILAITAAKWNVKTIYACDVDPIAVFTASHNAQVNRVADNILLFTGTVDCLRQVQFDIILANINRLEITRLLPDFVSLLKPDGKIIISGVLSQEEQNVLSVLNNLSFRALIIERMDEWLGLVIAK